MIINKHIIGYNICPITQMKIRRNELYMTCHICHYNYHKDSLDIWLENHNTCPNCRSIWTNKTTYKNVANEVMKKEHKIMSKIHGVEKKHKKQFDKNIFIKKEKQLMSKLSYQKFNKPNKKFYNMR
jgi:hypothetical protein